MSEEPKLNIRINQELKDKFYNWCKEQGTTPSDEVRRYITKLIKNKER